MNGSDTGLFDLSRGGQLPERDIYIIVIVVFLACPQTEEFEEPVALGGVLKGVRGVWGRLEGVRGRGRRVDVSLINYSNKLSRIRAITFWILLMRVEPQWYLITKTTRTQCFLGLLYRGVWGARVSMPASGVVKSSFEQ